MGQKGKDEIRTVIVERRVFEWFFFHPLRHSLDVVEVPSHHGRETRSSNRSSRKYSDVPIVKLDRNIRTDIRIMAFDILMKKFRRVGETQEREWDGDLNVIFIDEVSHGIFCTTLREKKSRSLDGHIASSSNYRI